MSVKAINVLKRLRRDFETLLALRHTLEQQRLAMDELAETIGSLALAELAEEQAETLSRLKVELAKTWRVLDETINSQEAD